MLADLATDLAMCESLAVACRAAGRRRRDRFRHRSVDAQDARLRSRDAHRHRGRAAARRLRLLQGLPRRAADARRQDHPDLGRHQPDPPPADRPQLRCTKSRSNHGNQDHRHCRRRHHGRGHCHRCGARGIPYTRVTTRNRTRWTAPAADTKASCANRWSAESWPPQKLRRCSQRCSETHDILEASPTATW